MKNIAGKLYCAIVVSGVLFILWCMHLQNQAQKEPVPADALRAFTEASACQAQAVREQLLQQAKIVLEKDLLPMKTQCNRLDKIARTQALSSSTDAEILESQRAILK
jgi:hypothetical protein